MCSDQIMVINFNRQVRALICSILARQGHPAVAKFLQELEYEVGSSKQVIQVDDPSIRWDVPKFVSLVEVAFLVAANVQEHLAWGDEVLCLQNFTSLPNVSFLDEEDGMDTLLSLDLSEELMEMVTTLREYWEDTTGGSDHNLVVLILSHLDWIVECLNSGNEVHYTPSPL